MKVVRGQGKLPSLRVANICVSTRLGSLGLGVRDRQVVRNQGSGIRERRYSPCPNFYKLRHYGAIWRSEELPKQFRSYLPLTTEMEG